MLLDEELAGICGRFESVTTGCWLFFELALSESEDSTRRRSGLEIVADDAIMGEKEPGARAPVGALDMAIFVCVVLCGGVSHVS